MQRIMKIENNDKWRFYQAYHDGNYIKSHDARKKVVLKERRESREYHLQNNSEQELVVYKIDGGIIEDNTLLKCDFGIYTDQDILYLIELKGADFQHALEQIQSTISLLLEKPNVGVNQLNVRIVLSKYRNPDILSTEEKKLNRILRTKYGNGTMKKQTRMMEESI